MPGRHKRGFGEDQTLYAGVADPADLGTQARTASSGMPSPLCWANAWSRLDGRWIWHGPCQVRAEVSARAAYVWEHGTKSNV